MQTERVRLNSADKLFVTVVLIPSLLLFIAFSALPIVAGFAASFTDWPILGMPKFLGLANYVDLAKDADFRRALLNTFLFAAFYVPPMIIAPLAMALLLDRPGRVSGFFRGVFFLPVVTSFVVLALIFRWIFQAGPGSMANQAVALIGLQPQSWLQDPNQALPLLALLGLIKGAAWNMVYFLAGLKTIPESYREAARVDGADAQRTFWNVILPLLRPTLYFVIVLTTINALQVFDSAYLLTQGGPDRATTTVVYFLYQAGFEQFRMGYASAAGIVLLFGILILTLIQKRWLGASPDEN